MSKTARLILSTVLRLAALLLLGAAGWLVYQQAQRYALERAVYPAGVTVAGIPMGGLEMGQAIERLNRAYLEVPVELRYHGALIQMDPAEAGLILDYGAMLTPAEVARTREGYWQEVWDRLWNRPPAAQALDVPLAVTFSEERLRAFLKEQVAARYDEAPVAAAPVAGTLTFSPARPGAELDIDQAVPAIAAALRSRSARQVELVSKPLPAPTPALDGLRLLFEQVIQRMGYQGVLELYLSSPKTSDKIELAYLQGQAIQPGIAFTAASTMKIPIMISVFRRQPDPLPADIRAMFTAMIEFSDNDISDKLIQTIEPNLGPLQLTKDLRTLGLQNSFLAGYYYPGAPLLQRFETPANQRSDVDTTPDAYNQTTPGEMGVLLEAIYTCAETGQGALPAAFPGQLTQSKCTQMIDFLANNRNGVLLEAGLPEGTRVAHKHGWTSDSDGLIHAISDAGIIFTPGGDFILSIYIYDREQVNWDRMNVLFALLTEAAYNFYNLPK